MLIKSWIAAKDDRVSTQMVVFVYSATASEQEQVCSHVTATSSSSFKRKRVVDMPFCQCTSTTHMPPPIDPDIVPQPRHAYTQSSVRVEHFQALILQGVYDLNQNEEWWRDQYGLLLSRGYKLRRRFRPDWTPSWLGTNLLPLHCEDSIRQIVSSWEHSDCPITIEQFLQDTRVLDAIKLDDNTRISIKRVASGKRNELEMAKFLSKPEMRDDPANHCVPIIDCFDSTDEGFKLLIMPYLHKFDRVPFLFVDEALDFVQQTMEVSTSSTVISTPPQLP